MMGVTTTRERLERSKKQRTLRKIFHGYDTRPEIQREPDSLNGGKSEPTSPSARKIEVEGTRRECGNGVFESQRIRECGGTELGSGKLAEKRKIDVLNTEPNTNGAQTASDPQLIYFVGFKNIVDCQSIVVSLMDHSDPPLDR